MNETIENAVQQLITRALDGVDTTVAFLDAELPEYITQLLLWYGIRSGLMCIMWTIFMFASVTFLVRSCRSDWETRDMTFENGGQLMLSIAFFFFSWLFWSLTWLKIWIAPKVWLLEYAGNLVK
jgi:hypothetical protein